MQKPMQNIWVRVYADDEEDAERIASNFSFKGIPTEIKLLGGGVVTVACFIFKEPADRLNKAYWNDWFAQNEEPLNRLYGYMHKFNKKISLARLTDDGTKHKSIPSESSRDEFDDALHDYVKAHWDPNQNETQVTAKDIDNLIGSIKKLF